jgi:P-type Ca2+ transporter type 2C
MTTQDRSAANGTAWHTRTGAEVSRVLEVEPAAGLPSRIAAERLAVHGPNALAAARRRGALRVLLAQFTDFMVLVLIGAAVVAGLLGEPQDIIAIVAILILNAALGFAQEYRAERAMAALTALAVPQAQVRRDGMVRSLPASELVPGDVVLLGAGNLVPADVRLVEAIGVRVDEATLTGESHPVDKGIAPLGDPDLPLGDRSNMAYQGTLVTYGRAVGIVTATGTTTELGRIAGLLEGVEAVKTPLQQRLAHLGARLTIAIIALCAVMFGFGLLRGEDPGLMFLTALSLAIAGMPEALPAVVTISLSLGARRMANRKALVRRLPAVETLGSVTYICSDKTGTLTENRMRVEAYDVGGVRLREPGVSAESEPWALLLAGLALCNDAVRGPDGGAQGDPTEVALLLAAAQAGREKAALDARYPRRGEIPFSSERARMTTLHRDGAEVLVFTKGAPEQVLAACGDRLTAAGRAPLAREAVLEAAAEMARDGLRVLAVAMRRLQGDPAALSPEAIEAGETLLGLVGLLDPPRPEVRDAVAQCQSAGIHVVMITGDHPATATAVARSLGIARAAEECMTGRQLAALSVTDLEGRVAGVRVYARVAPEQKIKIVEALQERHECVAMTGDGVNDAPALRRADIGVAMGRSGTDAAREAAHMILLDDNFATIVRAVREGRRIYDNLRKFVKYILTSGVAETLPLMLAPVLGIPIPLLPIQILWVNLVTDGLPGLALAAERAEAGVMERPPRPPQESLFAHGLWQHIVWVGLLMGSVTLGTQLWGAHAGYHWRSMTFSVLALSQMGHVLAIRSEDASLFRLGLWSNPALLGAVVVTLVLQLAILYVPGLTTVFGTQPLTGFELFLTLALSSIVFVAVEIEKWVKRKGGLRVSQSDRRRG